MALTRPKLAQIDTNISSITDPLTLLNKGGTLANVDIGFVLNRDNGVNSNVAIFWNETLDSFILGYTTSTGLTNANIALSEYANLYANTFYGNIGGGSVLANTYVTGSLLPSANITYDLGSPSHRWKTGYFAANTIDLGGSKISVDANGFSFTVNGGANKVEISSNGAITANTLIAPTVEFTSTQDSLNTSTGAIVIAGGVGVAKSITVGGNLTVSGNLFVNGNVTTINSNNLTITDSLIYLANDNPADTLDIGLVSAFTDAVRYQHTGLVRDASDGVWKLFANVVVEPTTTIDFTNATYSNLQLGGLAASIVSASGNISADSFTYPNSVSILDQVYTDLYALYSNAATQSDLLIQVAANIITTNTAMVGYVDTTISNSVTTANIGIIGYIDQANTIQSAQIASANVGIIGYIDQANSIQKAYTDGQISVANTAITAANVGMKGYVDAQLIYKANVSDPIFTGTLSGSVANFSSSGYFNEIFVTQSSGEEGGQINLAPSVTNNTLSGNIIIDVWNNRLRIFESSGTNRGAYMDLTQAGTGVSTNLLAGGGGGTPGGSDTFVQFNDGGLFSGATKLHYFKANGVIRANAGIDSTSTTSGTMQIVGGLGVTGNINAGSINTLGNISLTNTITATSGHLNVNANLIVANAYVTSSISDKIYFDNANLYIGLNETTPLYPLHVSAPAGEALHIQGSTGQQTWIGTRSLFGTWYAAGSDQHYVFSGSRDTADHYVLMTNGIVRANIHGSTGNVSFSNSVDVTNQLGTHLLVTDEIDSTSGNIAIRNNMSLLTGQTVFFEAGGIILNPTQIGVGTSTLGDEALKVIGNSFLDGDLTLGGNLFVNGNVTTINSNNLTITDSLIYLANDNPADSLDIGLVSSFINPDYQHTGLVRDASDGVWKLFANVVTEPGLTVDFTNATYSNLRIGNLISVNGNFSGSVTIGGDIAPSANNTRTVGSEIAYFAHAFVTNYWGTNSTLTGSVTVNSGNGATAIVNGGTTGVGNIGTSTTKFNTVFAKASSAQYADLAEVYTSDRNYIPGTVVVFGGEREVTVSLTSHDPSVAGVISTNPAYIMNSDCDGVFVALQGRVPCRVLGPVSKGDRVVSSEVRGVAERLDPSKYQPGCIIGKSLESVPDGEIATIEVVVGRN